MPCSRQRHFTIDLFTKTNVIKHILMDRSINA
jgi:hypothetical protein